MNVPRRCLHCGSMFSGARCGCATTVARGYGTAHRKARRRLARSLPAPCAYCHILIRPGERFNAAHVRVVSFDFRARIGALRFRLQKRAHDLGTRAERIVRLKRESLERLTLQLQERSPLKVLERGYAIATDAAGNVLRDAGQVAVGDRVSIQLHRGRITSEVKKKE